MSGPNCAVHVLCTSSHLLLWAKKCDHLSPGTSNQQSTGVIPPVKENPPAIWSSARHISWGQFRTCQLGGFWHFPQVFWTSSLMGMFILFLKRPFQKYMS